MVSEISGGIAYVFPGQGAQHVGMGEDLYDASAAARRVFDEANEVLGFDIRSLCFHGPEDELTDTFNAQPAILTASVAALEAFRERCDQVGISVHPSFMSGHSLGEYSALVAAGALKFRDAVALTRQRGRLSKEAYIKYPGGMAAIMGLDNSTLESICEQAQDKGVVVVANYNCPGQSVISGDTSAVEKAIELATAAGARRAVRLAITMASHSPLMREASASFAEEVQAATITGTTTPVVCNLTGRAIATVAEIKHELAEQLCGSVKWEQSVSFMVKSKTRLFLEFGPGQVLSGLIKRISKDVQTHSIGDLKNLEAAVSLFPLSSH